MPRNLWLALAVLGLAAAAFFALGRGPAERPFDEPSTDTTAGEPPSGPAVVRVADEVSDRPEDVERRELELVQDLGLVDSAEEFDARAPLALRGRVVDAQLRPVAGATVEPRVRRSPRAIFASGGPPPDLGVDFRELFRDRALAKAAVTGADGTFAFDGEAFAHGSSVELAIEHAQFAPAVVQREWTANDGALVLPDVVLGDGALVTGFVVGPTGTPVPAATVAFEQPGPGRGGRGRGGRGPGGGPFGGFGQDRLGELVGEATTDALGKFEIRHVPAGEFRLMATAPRHVDGRSEPVTAENGGAVDVGEIQLGPGAELTGIVVDANGAPVSDAEVSAMVSWEAATNEPVADQRGGRGGGFGRGAIWGARTSTRTDAAGRFALDRVPQSVLRVEVRHPHYADEDVDPVDPLAQPQIRIQVRGRPWATGIVLDAATGQPIESFGIRARPTRGFGPGRGGRGMADQRQRMAEQDPELAARIAEMEARAQREGDWRKRFVGDSGLVPERTPSPSAHPGGRFRLDDLDPGEVVIDVGAPGFVAAATGPFQVESGRPAEGLTIRLERGIAVEGRVLDCRDGAGIPGARVTVSIPPLEEQGAEPDPFAMFPGRGFGGRGRGGRGPGPRDVLAEARTDPTGGFRLSPLRPGMYVVSVQARDYLGIEDATFEVSAASVNWLRLDPGARVHGVVTGLQADQRVRLEFLHVETNARRMADVSAEDGSYELAGMMAGSYFVQLIEADAGGPRGDPRRRMGAAIAARAGATPDLVVEPGADVRFDVSADELELATVRGRVFQNGAPGDGLEVRLVAQVGEAGGLDPTAERFAVGRLAQLFSGRVSGEDGSFTIESVPPGDYVLEVRPRGGGRGGRGGNGGRPQLNFGGNALHSEPLTVRKAQTVERLVEVTTGALEITAVDAEGQPAGRARITLVLASEVGDAPPDSWNEAASLIRAGLRDGRFSSDAVAPGVYRVVVEATGFRPATGTVNVLAGDRPARLELKLEADSQAPPGGGR